MPNVYYRNGLTLHVAHVQKHEIYAVFHCLALHQSPHYKQQAGADATIPSLPNAERFSSCLPRFPMESTLASEAQQRMVPPSLHSTARRIAGRGDRWFVKFLKRERRAC